MSVENMSKKPVGLTMDVGWEFGIRRTFPITAREAWEFLISNEGAAIWLGKMDSMNWEIGKVFKTKEGHEGKITVFKPLSHMRIAWKRKGWDNYSVLQPRVIDGIGKAFISFHQEKLKDAKQRAEMKLYWNKVMEQIELEINRQTA